MEPDLIEELQPIKTEVLAVVKKYKQAGCPNTFLGVFSFLFSSTSSFVELVETCGKIVKTAKKETVVAAVQFAYAEMNPNLPWIPEPFESKIEGWLLKDLGPAFIDWIVAKYNEKGVFHK